MEILDLLKGLTADAADPDLIAFEDELDTDHVIDHVIDRVIDRMTDCVIDCVIDRVIDRGIDRAYSRYGQFTVNTVRIQCL